MSDEHAPIVALDRVPQYAVIVTGQQAQAAGQILREVRTAIRQIKAKYKKVRDEINLSIKGVKQMEQDDLGPYVAADATLSAAVQAWQLADRDRLAAERNALVAKAREDEAARRAASVAELTALAATAKGPEKQILNAQAKLLKTMPLTPTVDGPVPEATKIDGISLVEYHDAEVTDLALLVQAVARGAVPLAAIQPNQSFLDAQATSLGAEMTYPGVRVVTTYGQKVRGV